MKLIVDSALETRCRCILYKDEDIVQTTNNYIGSENYSGMKSTLMASLDSNLIIDLEDGYRALSVMDVQVRTSSQLFDVAKAIKAKISENKGEFPYKFITIDNATRLEEMSLDYAAHLYRGTPMGAGWGMLKDAVGKPVKDKNNKPIPDPKADVRTLPNGSGYLYLRQALRKMIDMFKPLCETLILVAHVKDKQIEFGLAA